MVIFGKLAEVAGEYLKKVHKSISKVLCKHVNGKTKVVKTATTEVVVNIGGSMQMLGGRGGDAASQGQGGQGGWGQPQQPQAQQFSGGGAPAARSSAPAPQTNEPPMDFDDDIPF